MHLQVYMVYPPGLSYAFMYNISSTYSENDQFDLQFDAGTYNKIKHYSEATADRRILATSYWPQPDVALNISSDSVAAVRLLTRMQQTYHAWQRLQVLQSKINPAKVQADEERKAKERVKRRARRDAKLARRPKKAKLDGDSAMPTHNDAAMSSDDDSAGVV